MHGSLLSKTDQTLKHMTVGGGGWKNMDLDFSLNSRAVRTFLETDPRNLFFVLFVVFGYLFVFLFKFLSKHCMPSKVGRQPGSGQSHKEGVQVGWQPDGSRRLYIEELSKKVNLVTITGASGFHSSRKEIQIRKGGRPR